MKQRPEAMAMSKRGPQDNGLTQVLADVLAEVRLSISRDISGADLLHSLLSAPWLRSLLRVYECLCQQKSAKTVLTPYLPYSSGLSQEVMANLREVTTPTPEILELYRLLEKPHVQALLLTHDTVAKRDYDPVLPPVPADLPDEEEAMRIVCMVKNKQPLTPSQSPSSSASQTPSHAPPPNAGSNTPSQTATQPSSSPSSSPASSSTQPASQTPPQTPKVRVRHRWDNLRRYTMEKLATSKILSLTDGCSMDQPGMGTTSLPVQKCLLVQYDPMGNQLCYQTCELMGAGLASSAPTIYTPALIDNVIVDVRSRDTPKPSGSLSPHQKKGATIKKDLKTKEILVARVIHGGLADRNGLLNPGDKLVEVNGRPMRGLEPEQVIQILTNSRGTIVFKVIPNLTQPDNHQATVFVRAMADYAPLLDPTIPCPAAGMAFHKGELLEIVDQTDSLWWQARKLHSSATCAGLIPSTNSLKKRLREVWFSEPTQGHTCIRPYSPDDDDDDFGLLDLKFDDTDEDAVETDELSEEEADNYYTREGIYIAGFRRSIRLWRRKTQNKRRQSCHSCCPSNSHGSVANPYEEVVTFQRNPEDPPRLIALIGPSGVGVNELRKQIIKINPRKFQGAVPHTTRPLKRSEEAGREYHFISRELFEYMAYNHRFLEYGEYKGHFYGTSVDAIKEVLDTGKVCVIDIEPHSIQSIRTKRLRPFIIFIRPPSLERLRQTRRNAKIFTSYQLDHSFREEDFREMEESSRRLEALYGHFFDRVLVNDDLRETSLQLFNLIQHAQDDSQWIPTAWTLPDEP